MQKRVNCSSGLPKFEMWVSQNLKSEQCSFTNESGAHFEQHIWNAILPKQPEEKTGIKSALKFDMFARITHKRDPIFLHQI